MANESAFMDAEYDAFDKAYDAWMDQQDDAFDDLHEAWMDMATNRAIGGAAEEEQRNWVAASSRYLRVTFLESPTATKHPDRDGKDSTGR